VQRKYALRERISASKNYVMRITRSRDLALDEPEVHLKAMEIHPNPETNQWAALKSAAGAAFLLAALYEIISASLDPSLRHTLQWILPITGAIAGYLIEIRVLKGSGAPQ
jgi:hypothetical protein